MISLDIIDTDAFLDMPQSSQLLYFHLNSRADDDGFVANPKRIMRDIGSQVDDLKILATKKFIIVFDDGVCVIKHWRINNFIRKDIYKPTKYINWKKTLFIRNTGAYTLTKDGAIKVPEKHFNLEDIEQLNPYVDATLTKRQLRIGKVRKGKDISIHPAVREKEDAFDEFWAAYPKKEQKKKSREIWQRKKLGVHLDKMLKFIEEAKNTERWQKGFIKQPPTFLNGECWDDDLEAYGKKQKNSFSV